VGAGDRAVAHGGPVADAGAAPIRHFAKKKTATAASRRRERVHVGAARGGDMRSRDKDADFDPIDILILMAWLPQSKPAQP
jgi:hypothetical protein